MGTPLLPPNPETPAPSSAWLARIADSANLAAAWDKVRRNQGAPGVDGVTIQAFEYDAARQLQSLRDRLLSGSYQPHPVRAVDIPKPSGGLRTLGIPTVMDRVAQQAVAQVLSPVWERLFSPSSHAYRPGRDALDAVAQVQQQITAGREHIVDLDIEKFFDHIHHEGLIEQVRAQVPDESVLHLIRSCLEAGIIRSGYRLPTTEGTPQGSPLSPLLANIVLHEFDQHLDGKSQPFARYADDVAMLCETEGEARAALDDARSFLSSHLHLALNEAKTRLCSPPELTFLGFSFVRDSAGAWRRTLSAASLEVFRTHVDQVTERDAAAVNDAAAVMHELAAYVHGWENYYRHPETAAVVKRLRAHARTAVRRLLWRLWSTPEHRVAELVRRGIAPNVARDFVQTCPDAATAGASTVMGNAVPNAFFATCGLGPETAPGGVPYGVTDRHRPMARSKSTIASIPRIAAHAAAADKPTPTPMIRPGDTGVHCGISIALGRFGFLRGSLDLRLPADKDATGGGA